MAPAIIIIDYMEPAISLFTLISGTLVGAAAASVGSFLLLRKLTLVSDSLPHIALPGIALGIIYNFNPILGAFLFLLLAVLIVWLVQFKTRLEVDSIVGVLFVTALAIGSTLVEEEELLESFFGDITSVGQGEGMILGALGLVVLASIVFLRKQLVLHSIAPELEQSLGRSKGYYEIVFLALVALVVAAGIKFVGVLLMSALLIVPAVTSRLVAGESLARYQLLSVILGALSIGSGIYLSGPLDIEAGILTVVIGAVLFAVSLTASLVRRRTF